MNWKYFSSLYSVPLVLVGNKCDLLNDREVTTDEGRKLAEQMKAIFLETSAKNNQARTTTTYNAINICLVEYHKDI